MYISHLHIDNVRRFSNGSVVNLDLARPDGSYAGWTVFAGRNGSGKSTLLQALALTVVGPDYARSLKPTFESWIHQGSRDAGVTVTLAVDPVRDRYSEGKGDASSSVQPRLTWLLTADGGPEPSLVLDPREDWEFVRHGPWHANPEGWFLAGYGPFRRLTGAGMDPAPGPVRVRRLSGLFNEGAVLVDAVEWLVREVYFKALEKRNGAEALLEQVKQLLNDGLLPDGALISKVDSDGIWVKQAGNEVELRGLSDGYRVVIALVLDLVRLLHGCYGELNLRQHGGRVVVDLPGVVLVDEIEAHLHIAWQKSVGFWLTQRFPAIQFLVATHSPFVCQAASPNGLIRLLGPGEQGGVEVVDSDTFLRVTRGDVDEAVLSNLFGLESSRSAEADRLLSEYSQLRALEMRGDAMSREQALHLERLRAELPRTTTLR